MEFINASSTVAAPELAASLLSPIFNLVAVWECRSQITFST